MAPWCAVYWPGGCARGHPDQCLCGGPYPGAGQAVVFIHLFIYGIICLQNVEN